MGRRQDLECKRRTFFYCVNNFKIHEILIFDSSRAKIYKVSKMKVENIFQNFSKNIPSKQNESRKDISKL